MLHGAHFLACYFVLSPLYCCLFCFSQRQAAEAMLPVSLLVTTAMVVVAAVVAGSRGGDPPPDCAHSPSLRQVGAAVREDMWGGGGGGRVCVWICVSVSCVCGCWVDVC